MLYWPSGTKLRALTEPPFILCHRFVAVLRWCKRSKIGLLFMRNLLLLKCHRAAVAYDNARLFVQA